MKKIYLIFFVTFILFINSINVFAYGDTFTFGGEETKSVPNAYSDIINETSPTQVLTQGCEFTFSWSIYDKVILYGNAWKYNQIAPNVLAGNYTGNGISNLSFSNGVATFTTTRQYANLMAVNGSLSTVANHKYYVSVDIKTNELTDKIAVMVKGGGAILGTTQNSLEWQTVNGLFTETNNRSTTQVVVSDRRTTGYGVLQVKNIVYVDLTEMFGVGNEPITIDDEKITLIKSLPKEQTTNLYVSNGNVLTGDFSFKNVWYDNISYQMVSTVAVSKEFSLYANTNYTGSTQSANGEYFQYILTAKGHIKSVNCAETGKIKICEIPQYTDNTRILYYQPKQFICYFANAPYSFKTQAQREYYFVVNTDLFQAYCNNVGGTLSMRFYINNDKANLYTVNRLQVDLTWYAYSYIIDYSNTNNDDTVINMEGAIFNYPNNNKVVAVNNPQEEIVKNVVMFPYGQTLQFVGGGTDTGGVDVSQFYQLIDVSLEPSSWLSVIPSIFNNLLVWLFCEMPLLSNITKPIFIMGKYGGSFVTTYILPLLSALGVFGGVIGLIFLIRILVKFVGEK